MRSDLQCLRGIAILLVFLFHLFPNLFVNGFLGVDIFFVISGFLMAKALTRSELRTINDFVQFYYRRFRRILPLYVLVIAITVVMVHLYLGDYLWENNNRYSLASLFLVTNQLVIHDQADYFKEFFTSTSSINAFLHLWSLSVEMQFYLLVPFIFFGLQLLKHDYLKLIAASLTTLFGFITFALINQPFAFNFMLLRLWQFSAGFVALFWNKIQLENLPKTTKTLHESIFKFPITKYDIYTFSLSILGCCLLPNNLNVLVLRPLVTISTAFIIASETQNCQILNSKFLGYIGDISYVMYLVHWPLIAIFSPYTVQHYIFLIVSVFLCSIILHHIFEQKYLNLEWKSLTTLIVSLALCNAFLQYSVREHGFWNMTYPLELQRIVDINKAQMPVSWVHEPERFECEEEVFEAEGVESMGYGHCMGGRGNTSVMMIGNSYVMNLRDPIRRHFHYNYSDFRYIALGEGYGFYGDTSHSQVALEVSRKDVERYTPDVLFILARYTPSLRYPIEENDAQIKQINENIKFYEKFVKKIYILDSHPLYQEGFADFFLQCVVNRPEALETLHLDRRKADEVMKFTKKRFSMVKCTKCHFFDLSHIFVDGDKYLTFDRDQLISYIDTTVHLSAAGLKMCDSEFERIAREIMDSL